MRMINGAMSRAGHTRSISWARAAAESGAPRIRPITSSMLATAIARPTWMCALSRALVSIYLVRRVTTSSRKSRKARSMSLSVSVSGRPPFKAIILALQLDDDAHPVAIGFVPQISDAFDPFFPDEFSDPLDQGRLVDLVGDLADDQSLAIPAQLLDRDF